MNKQFIEEETQKVSKHQKREIRKMQIKITKWLHKSDWQIKEQN